MTVIHLTQQLQSDTLHVPELKPLIGKQVEITIRELPVGDLSDPNRFKPLEELAGKDLIDANVIDKFRNQARRAGSQ
ncbi:MAG TPA: hypothetical protein VMP01_07855 [Pirellulaceae bacterium]|nr:hypothetical protein [Pirellulaceae bacterium]